MYQQKQFSADVVSAHWQKQQHCNLNIHVQRRSSFYLERILF